MRHLGPRKLSLPNLDFTPCQQDLSLEKLKFMVIIFANLISLTETTFLKRNLRLMKMLNWEKGSGVTCSMLPKMIGESMLPWSTDHQIEILSKIRSMKEPSMAKEPADIGSTVRESMRGEFKGSSSSFIGEIITGSTLASTWVLLEFTAIAKTRIISKCYLWSIRQGLWILQWALIEVRKSRKDL